MIVNIDVDKHAKVKVHKIYITGNEVLSDRKLKRVIKKTNESGNLLKLFSQKKFVESDYQDDLNRILEKYNELGYRNAKFSATASCHTTTRRSTFTSTLRKVINITLVILHGSATPYTIPTSSTISWE